LYQGYAYIKNTVTKISIEIAVNSFDRKKKTSHTTPTHVNRQTD